MEHLTTTTKAESERLRGIAEELLRNKDFAGCKELAIEAQKTEALLDGSDDQILALAEVLLASKKRVDGEHRDWYSVLGITQRKDDPELIRNQYCKLAHLLRPDKNKFPFADNAFRLVANAWSVLSDPQKKALFDNVLSSERTQATEEERNPNDSAQKLPGDGRSNLGCGSNSAASSGNNDAVRGDVKVTVPQPGPKKRGRPRKNP